MENDIFKIKKQTKEKQVTKFIINSGFFYTLSKSTKKAVLMKSNLNWIGKKKDYIKKLEGMKNGKSCGLSKISHELKQWNQ